MAKGPAIRSLTATEARAFVPNLAAVLVACVADGASVNFMASYSQPEAEAFFAGVATEVAAGRIALLAALDESSQEEEKELPLLGTVQVRLAMPPNAPHRAEIAKMLVHPRARRCGLGSALLVHAEHCAALAGKTLLILDTATGSQAESLYRRHGWTTCGVIPDFALFPDGRPCSTTIFYKQIHQKRLTLPTPSVLSD